MDSFKPKKKDCKLHELDHLDQSKFPQWPHIDYSWDILLIDSRRRRGFLVDKGSKGGLKHGFMPYTLHMPLTPKGSYVYIWFGQGLSCPIHNRYGHILCLRGDVMHCGEVSQPYLMVWAIPEIGTNAFIFTFLPMLEIFWIILFLYKLWQHFICQRSFASSRINVILVTINILFSCYESLLLAFLIVGVPVTGSGTTSHHWESMIANVDLIVAVAVWH